jgi:hypothetical protein
MKIILHRGGNYYSGGADRRFDASPDPQEVPAPFGEAMIARGVAERVEAPKPAQAASPSKKASGRRTVAAKTQPAADSTSDGDDD